MTNLTLLSPIEAAAYLRIAEPTLKKWRKGKKGPIYYKLGKIIKYKIEDLDAFIEASRVENSVAVAAATVNREPTSKDGMPNVKCTIEDK